MLIPPPKKKKKKKEKVYVTLKVVSQHVRTLR